MRPLPRNLYIVTALLSLLLVSWADSWEGLKKAAGDIQSIKADFTQKKNMSILARPLISKGRLYYQRPSSLRWEYTSPVQSVLLMHRGSLRRYIKGSKGFTEDSTAQVQSMAVVLDEITSWLGGEFNQNPDFVVSLKQGTPTRIILTPKNEAMKKIISTIELSLSQRPGVIDRVIISEGASSNTVIDFTSIKINTAINESQFKKL